MDVKPSVFPVDAPGLDRRQWLQGGVVLALLGLSVGGTGCATVGPREFTLSERQMLAALSGRFPASRRVLEIFEIRLSSPRLKLLPTEDRLMLGFDAGDSTVRLDRVRREHLAIEGLPSLLSSSVNRWGGMLAEELLEGAVVHTVDRATIDQAARQGVRPGAIRVTEGGVTVTLEPIRAQGA